MGGLNNVSFGDELFNAGIEDSVLGSAILGTADGERPYVPTAIPAPLFAGNSSAFSIDDQDMNFAAGINS